MLYEGVKDVLTAAVSQTTIQAGQTLTFTGTVAPDHTGHVVYLERQNASGDGASTSWRSATVTAGSTYSIAHTVYDARHEGLPGATSRAARRTRERRARRSRSR